MILEIIKYYGSDETKTEFINHDSEPLMAVIAHDRSHAVVSLLDEVANTIYYWQRLLTNTI